jgi:hypothetical protein
MLLDNRIDIPPRNPRRAPIHVVLLALFVAWFPVQAQQLTDQPTPAAVAVDPASPAATPQPAQFDSGSRLAGIARTIGKDELHFIKAPFKKNAIVWDVLLLGSTVGLAASDTDETVLHDVPVAWHQTSRNISNGAVYGTAGIATAIYLTGLMTKNESAQETGIRTAEATVDSVIMYGALKVISARQRPFTGPGEGKFFSGNWSNSSFPSGHAMFTWTIASTIAHRYHSIPLDILLYGLAGTVTTTRVTAGQHFPSDVIVGSVLGYLIGDYVAHKQESGFPIRSSKLKRAENAVLQHVTIGGQ